MALSTPLGIYIHVPFCGKKCPYCDFYSGPASVSKMDAYTDAVCCQLLEKKEENLYADTLYFGGGTPNLLGAERLSRLITTAKSVFSIPQNGEITVEANPATVTLNFLQQIFAAGANRLSLGMQSAIPEELRLLGRRHTPEQVTAAVKMAQSVGFSNISVDLMLGIPGQTEESLRHSLAFCDTLDVQHVSAYLLKVEPDTAYFTKKEELCLPDEDTAADWYLLTVKTLREIGFAQYEISNFAKEGFAGRHNLKYWHGQEYFGFGPAAHSFYDGKRFYYPRDLNAFLHKEPPIPDGSGGDMEDFILLQMRLTEGLSDTIWHARFNESLPSGLIHAAKRFEKLGLITFTAPNAFHFTPQGFLVSNPLIVELVENLKG